MAELMARDGTWSFDGDRVWIVPGRDRGVHRLRQDLGETSVPLEALAGIAYEPARKGGRLRLRLRDGADPLLYVTGGGLPDDANPYQVAVDPDRTGVAEYFADEVRQAMLLDQVATGPTDRYLLPGPAVPLSAAGVDGVATFDGEHVHIDWRWTTSESKKHAGARDFALADLAGVDWRPASGLESGYLRFRPKGVTAKLKPEHDPNAIELWGFKKESGRTALLAAAVAARLPHPSGGAAPGAVAGPEAGAVAGPPAAPALEKAADAGGTGAGSGGDGADVLLRRLRELGELHRDGILTAEEFSAAKAAVLKDFHGTG
ncbi:DUF4429 domain-containing protein [Streptomyces sp. NPDC059788]|uniref:DUF4429 domain-containing protein n=1 Tax=Streptomyces sp. NPDC059788 TaxID=3346948 RepID=UPI003659CD68